MGVSFAPEHRLLLSVKVEPTVTQVVDKIVEETIKMCSKISLPIFVSDGQDSYGQALLTRLCIIETFPPTGRRGRPRIPKISPSPNLHYAQVIKERNGYRVVSITKKVIFGQVDDSQISTSFLERQNLNFRHDNRRLTRKTIAFSKKDQDLLYQLNFYKAYHNLVRPHRGLRGAINEKVIGKVTRKWRKVTPAVSAGIADHVWSLRQLMTYRVSPINCQ